MNPGKTHHSCSSFKTFPLMMFVQKSTSVKRQHLQGFITLLMTHGLQGAIDLAVACH